MTTNFKYLTDFHEQKTFLFASFQETWRIFADFQYSLGEAFSYSLLIYLEAASQPFPFHVIRLLYFTDITAYTWLIISLK